MGNQLNRIGCEICKKDISSKRYAISRHIKEHGITYEVYVSKYFKLVSGVIETCGFCDEDAIPTYVVNCDTKEYSFKYDNGYFCGRFECKCKISFDILGIKYDSKKYEKIGSKSEYLSKLYKISISESKLKKYKERKVEFRCSLSEFIHLYGAVEGKNRYEKRIKNISKNSARINFSPTLSNYIDRYGIDLGTEKYKKRCDRISYTSSKDFFIEKYGEVEGERIWKNKFKQNRVSKKSQVIGDLLSELHIRYVCEYSVGSKFVDYYLPEFNMVIEYFGNYWHANPKIYESTYIVSQIKLTASEIWDNDRNRFNLIKKEVGPIIVIWESTQIDLSYLEKIINEMKNKKTIIYI